MIFKDLQSIPAKTNSLDTQRKQLSYDISLFYRTCCSVTSKTLHLTKAVMKRTIKKYEVIIEGKTYILKGQNKSAVRQYANIAYGKITSILRLNDSGKTVQRKKTSDEPYISAGEERIARYLDLHQIEYKREYPICKNKSTGRMLRADFYLPNDNMVIEFDGLHHYSPKSKFNKGYNQLKKTWKRDKVKDAYCRANKIKMLRIGYQQFHKIEEILRLYL